MEEEIEVGKDEELIDEEKKRLMEEHNIDAEDADALQELIDGGLDEDDAVEMLNEI